MPLPKRGWRAHFHLHLDSSTTIAALQYYTAMQSFPCVAKRIGFKVASQGRMRRWNALAIPSKEKEMMGTVGMSKRQKEWRECLSQGHSCELQYYAGSTASFIAVRDEARTMIVPLSAKVRTCRAICGGLTGD